MSSTDSSFAVRCINLQKHFGRTPAVNGVDLDVPLGRFVALLGPSGCGKTTTLRLIAGFEQPDAGTIEVAGEVVAQPRRITPPERRRIGMVFQEGALFPHMNVEKNIAYGLTARRPEQIADQTGRVHEMLNLVGLAGLGRRMPHELSGGQQQRVALARALAPGPAVVLLDEPFSSLDAGLRARLRTEVRAILRQAAVTVVFVTHDQDEALSLADDIAVMDRGRIVQRATPYDLYARPATAAVARFLGETTFVSGHTKENQVTTELGTLNTDDSALRGEVSVMLRPEAIRLTADSAGSARVTEIEYYGHDCMVHVALPSGTTLKARLAGTTPIGPGDTVTVTVTGPVRVFAATST